MHFGNWLKREIENRLLTQVAFSRKVGVAETTLIKWCQSPRPSIRGLNIVRLAQALELPREEVESHLGLQTAA